MGDEQEDQDYLTEKTLLQNIISKIKHNSKQSKIDPVPQQDIQLVECYLNADHQKDSNQHILQECKHLSQGPHKNPQPEDTLN